MFRRELQSGVSLQLLEDRHAPAVFQVVDHERAHLREWLPWVDKSTNVEHTRTFIHSTLEQFRQNEGFSAGIWRDGGFIGVIGTHKIDWMYRRVEIGYWIASGFQGRGIVTEACRAVIDHAFREWELHRVEIHCATGNDKSCAIAKRLGFQLEGVLREAQLVGDRYLDIAVYSMLAREWK